MESSNPGTEDSSPSLASDEQALIRLLELGLANMRLDSAALPTEHLVEEVGRSLDRTKNSGLGSQVLDRDGPVV